MIVDDLARKSPWLASFCETAMIFKMPFEVCWNFDRTWPSVIPRGLEPTVAGTDFLQTLWARPPYEHVVLIGNGNVGALTIQAVPVERLEEGCSERRFNSLSRTALYALRLRIVANGGDQVDSFPVMGEFRDTGVQLRKAWYDIGRAHMSLGPIPAAEHQESLKSAVIYQILSQRLMNTSGPDELAMLSRSRDAIAESKEFLNVHGADEVADWFGFLTWRMVETMVTAFSLLNCKNVVTSEVVPPHARAAARRGDPPLYRYRTVHVRPFRSRRTGSSSGGCDPVAVHWVRGHFKEYTTERPLLGRHVGLFWWQPHLAGRAERFSDKEYRVHA